MAAKPGPAEHRAESPMQTVERASAESVASLGTRYPRAKPAAPGLVETHTAESFSAFPVPYHGAHTPDSAGEDGSCSQCGIKPPGAEDIFRAIDASLGFDPDEKW